MSTAPEEPGTAISQIDKAVRFIEEARLLNKKQQNGFRQNSPEWHLCESIDDKLFESLCALGQ